jgi:hypothetical protein
MTRVLIVGGGVDALGVTDVSPAARSDVAGLRFAGEPLLVASGLAHTIRYRDVPVQAARATLRVRGVSDWQIEQLLGSAEVVARLVGRPPRAFAEFAHELAAA